MQTILFEFESPYGVFRDAIILTDEEFAVLTPADITAMKQARFDNWLSIIRMIRKHGIQTLILAYLGFLGLKGKIQFVYPMPVEDSSSCSSGHSNGSLKN